MTIISHLPPADVQLLAVERMIRQILINLLGNAIKFTPAGGELIISGAARPAAAMPLVRDTGIGMNDDDIAKALTPFGQVANKMTATHTGTGLGLPLAKAMLELHGGELTIISEPHHGTTMVLSFPASRISRATGAVAA